MRMESLTDIATVTNGAGDVQTVNCTTNAAQEKLKEILRERFICVVRVWWPALCPSLQLNTHLPYECNAWL